MRSAASSFQALIGLFWWSLEPSGVKTEPPHDEVISGTARGADYYGELCADRAGIPVTHFPAKWDDLDAPGALIKEHSDGTLYNANAGHDRNEEMAVYAAGEYILLFMGGPGTASMRDAAIRHGIEIVYDEFLDDEPF